MILPRPQPAKISQYRGSGRLWFSRLRDVQPH